MTDRTEELLAEMVELQRRQLANQERAIAHQAESIALQQRAVHRQASALKRVWILIVLVVALFVAMSMLSWMLRSAPR